MSERVFKFVFDKKAMKPACVLLQALYGGDREPCFFFTEWQVNPTPDMVGVQATESELRQLAKICNERAAPTAQS